MRSGTDSNSEMSPCHSHRDALYLLYSSLQRIVFLHPWSFVCFQNLPGQFLSSSPLLDLAILLCSRDKLPPPITSLLPILCLEVYSYEGEFVREATLPGDIFGPSEQNRYVRALLLLLHHMTLPHQPAAHLTQVFTQAPCGCSWLCSPLLSHSATCSQPMVLGGFR